MARPLSASFSPPDRRLHADPLPLHRFLGIYMQAGAAVCLPSRPRLPGVQVRGGIADEYGL